MKIKKTYFEISRNQNARKHQKYQPKTLRQQGRYEEWQTAAEAEDTMGHSGDYWVGAITIFLGILVGGGSGRFMGIDLCVGNSYVSYICRYDL